MKKRIFSTAVAVAAAMSLSVSAFAAAGPGESPTNPGWSDLVGGSDYVLEKEIDRNEKTVTITSPDGMGITGPTDAFPEGVTKVYLVASVGALSDEAKESTLDAINEGAPEGKEFASVNYGVAVKLLDQNHKEFEPLKSLTVIVAQNDTNKDSNTVAFIGDEVEVYGLTVKDHMFNFTVPHFSNYYLGIEDATTPPTPETTPKPSEPTPDGGFNGGGSTDTKKPDDTTKPEDSSTAAPSATTANGGNTTEAPADGTTVAVDVTPDGNGGSSDDFNSDAGNAGDTNSATGNDKNQATGVVLAVVPAAIAAAAVVISKKRK